MAFTFGTSRAGPIGCEPRFLGCIRGSRNASVYLSSSEQLWLADTIAGQWRFPAGVAADATGMGLDDDTSASLPLPAKGVVLEYAARSFAAADRAAAEAALSEQIFAALCTDLYGRQAPIGDVVIGHLSHAGTSE